MKNVSDCIGVTHSMQTLYNRGPCEVPTGPQYVCGGVNGCDDDKVAGCGFMAKSRQQRLAEVMPKRK